MAAYPDLTSSVSPGNPLSEKIEFKTILSNFDDLGEEQRKQKWLYPRRNYTLKYNWLTKADARTLWLFFLARKGQYEAFNLFLPYSSTYTGEYVGSGDASTLVFNTPSKTASSYALYVDGSLQTITTHYTYSSGGGADGADQVTFVSAPADGARITWDFTGYLKVRSRFSEDFFSFETFYNRLVNVGVNTKGLLNA